MRLAGSSCLAAVELLALEVAQLLELVQVWQRRVSSSMAETEAVTPLEVNEPVRSSHMGEFKGVDVDEVWRSAMEQLDEATRARAFDDVVVAWHRMLDALSMLGQTDALVALEVEKMVREELIEMVQPDLVRWAREQGGTWAEIGLVQGMTKAGAHQKWRHLERGTS